VSENLSVYAAALQDYWAPNVCKTVYFKDNPFFSMVKKDPNWGGKSEIRIPLVWAPGGGMSTQFGTAQIGAAANYTRINEFKISRHKTHAVGYIDNELIRATRGNMPAFVSATKTQISGIVTNLGRDLEICAFRDGYGVRGRLSSTQTLTATTIVLATPSDAFNFEVGQRHDLTAAVGSTAAAKAYGTSTNPLIITAVDTDAGTVSVGYALNNAANGIPTVAASDYLVMAGDVGTNSATYYRSKPCGISGWCPDAAPTSGDNFYGLDRSVSNRLYGQRIDCTASPNVGLTLTEAVNKGVGKMSSYGGKLTNVWGSWNTYEDFCNHLGSRVQFVEREVLPGIGFRGIRIVTPKGDAEFYPSTGCDDNHMFLTDMGTITLFSLDDAVTVSDEDGFEMVRAYNQDACEVRYKTMGNYGCNNPGGGLCSVRLR
jgi:hypothetical protein